MTASNDRYAVYFAPAPESNLWRTGCHWFGHNSARPVAGALPPEVAAAGLSEVDWTAMTAAPRRYGFHATLKPPFALADGHDLSDLDTALARFAAGRKAFAAAPLAVHRLDGFLALCPAAPDSGLTDLAADCVEAFDLFRRPPGPDELARRRARGLTPRQESLLQTWGYPYVMDEFRFHLTLTGRLNDETAARIKPVLDRMFSDVLGGPLAVDGITLCREPAPGAPFERVRRYNFAGR